MASDAIKKEMSECEAEETLLLLFRLSHQFPDLAAFLPLNREGRGRQMILELSATHTRLIDVKAKKSIYSERESAQVCIQADGVSRKRHSPLICICLSLRPVMCDMSGDGERARPGPNAFLRVNYNQFIPKSPNLGQEGECRRAG